MTALNGLRNNEHKLLLAVAINASMMGFEIIFGWISGSMALLADGWHMATHVGALLISWLAYWLVRRWANNTRLTQGASDILPLAGSTNAIILAIVGVVTIWASVEKIVSPAPIQFKMALMVAVIGLLVNLMSAWVLRMDHHDHSHDHNIQSAYLHVLTDALTSILAIIGLGVGWLWGVTIIDPLLGVLGGAMIMRWGITMAIASAKSLIHYQP